jgi:hypothetical protein
MEYMFHMVYMVPPSELEPLSMNREALPIKNIMRVFVLPKIAGYQKRSNHRNRDPSFRTKSGLEVG